ncbi:Ig domain-containing protein [Reinekea marinisedimentorum]|uniref:Parallel beta helix pectate lyase-like protein n=1 Tax=Reinekea marinisedimentorum TaxID=230495 RepID=A0A4R3IES8_9GAMM|nr:Ig domain-containing protein [Reinekea marinisedimentorum]TCS44118.1 hypothetical protein BCF53_101461 [Reinekea marinisedimentorum]
MKLLFNSTVLAIVAMFFSSFGYSADFPLDEGEFISAKMPMHLVYPRPNIESNADSRHRWAHSEMEYQIPIGVQGGAWPFKYELVEAPAGAEIGEYFDGAGYGVISWTPSSNSGTYSFEVLVTDQDGSTVTAEWTVDVDNEKFVFIEDEYNGVQSGTFNEPLEDFSDWYLGDAADTTYAGKIVVFRGGNYSMVGDADNNYNVNFTPADKTLAFVGYPGEKVVVDSSKAQVIFSNDEANDFYVSGINWDNARVDVGNPKFFWFGPDASRTTFWKNTFSNITAGTSGTDNAGPIFYGHSNALRENIFIKSNTFNYVTNSDGGNGHYVDLYRANYVLVESNEAKNSKTNYGFWMKATNAYVTVRDNVAVEDVYGRQIAIHYGDASETIPHDHEVCWNRIRTNEEYAAYRPSLAFAVIFGENFDWREEHYNSFLYRNTVITGFIELRNQGASAYQAEDNLAVANIVSDVTNNDTSLIYATGNIALDTSEYSVDEIVDDQGYLISGSTYRSSYLGVKGAELAGRYSESAIAPVYEEGSATKVFTD